MEKTPFQEQPSPLERKTEFDADFPPAHSINRQAAQDHGVQYDPRKRAYTDEDGCIIYDRFGQAL